MNQHLHLHQKPELRQRLSAQQLRLIHLLGLSALEFEQCVRNELDENPALEMDDPDPAADASAPMPAAIDAADYLPYYADASPHGHEREWQIPDRSSGIRPDLLQQISTLALSDRQRNLCGYLAGMLDDDGCLRRSFPDIANDVLFALNIETEPQEWEAALGIVQSLDPAGIGARSIQECLLLQLRRKPNAALAIGVLERHFDDFVHKKYDLIASKLGVSREAIDDAAAEIRRLNPKPGYLLASDTAGAAVIAPDFIVENRCGELVQTLAPKHLPKLRISRHYSQMAGQGGREAGQFAEQKTSEAAWFIKAVKQRARTLELIMGVVAAHQQRFFLTGCQTDLRPLSQYAVAQKTGYDKSTISRAVNSKYVQTNFGIFPLKHFFAAPADSSKDGALSVVHLRAAIADIIAGENKRQPLRDIDISLRLRGQGFEAARRTVAKYREEMGIPAVRLRKEQ